MIRKKNKSQSIRKPFEANRSSVPIARYYQSQHTKSLQTRTTKRSQQYDDSIRLSDSQSSSRRFSFLSLFTVFGVFIVLIFSALLTGKPVVRLIESSFSYRDQEAYSKGVQSIIESKPLLRSKLTARASLIETEIRKAFPEVEKVSVVVPLVGQRLQVGLKTYEPALLAVSQAGSFGIVSPSGIVVYKTQDTQNIPKVAVIPQAQLEVGEALMTRDEVSFIKLIDSEFQAQRPFKLPTIEGYELDIAKNEVIVRFVDAPYIIRFSTQANPRQQVSSVLAFYESIEQGSSSAPPVEYIDARVVGRLFIK